VAQKQQRNSQNQQKLKGKEGEVVKGGKRGRLACPQGKLKRGKATTADKENKQRFSGKETLVGEAGVVTKGYYR